MFLGGGIGAVLRHGVNRLSTWVGLGFPIGTMTVNVLGSFLMGLLVGLLPDTSQGWRLFLATGVLGGFTTFSAFSLDALALWQRGEVGPAALYVAGSVLLSLAAVALGAVAARLF